MNRDKLYLGIDYGGNAVKLGLVDGLGNLSGKASLPTEHLTDKGKIRAFAAQIADFVHSMGIYSSELNGVGLAIPGIAKEDGYLTPNVKTDWPVFIDAIAHAFGRDSIAVVNDANAAALGELWKGAGQNYPSVLLITIGSGIGSGLVMDGNVISGGHGAAGEIGHMTVVRDGRLCKCGRKGCLERYASARGLVQTYLEASESPDFDPTTFCSIEPSSETDALSVFHAADAGDPRALFAIEDGAQKLGFALAQAACTIDPSIILIGGGISRAANYYMDTLREAYEKNAFTACKNTPIQCAMLMEDAGVIGAARYAQIQNPTDQGQHDWLDSNFGL